MKFGGRRVNYKKLLSVCSAYGNVIQATAYAAQIDNQASKFFECLGAYGFDVKIKVPKEYGAGDNIRRKADHDVKIAIDMVRFAPRVENIVLCTADGDLVDAIEYVQHLGCKVIVIGCGISNDLKMLCKTIEIGPSLLEDENEIKTDDTSAPTK
jgi:uncharacterized LabA/DUF88 family protein